MGPNLQAAERARLQAAYLQQVAAIRLSEAKLRTTLLDPLAQVPGVVAIDWRIKSWEATLAKVSIMQSHGRPSFGIADVADLLGVRVVIASPHTAQDVCDVVANAFEVTENARHHYSGGPRGFHREHLHVVSRADGDASFGFEVQILSRVAEALINAEHALTYGQHGPSELLSNMASWTLRAEAFPVRVAAAVDEAVDSTTKLDAIIDAFEKMISDPGVHEKRDVHPYLKQHPFLLHTAPESIISEPAIGLGTEYRLDFIVREPTGEYLLVELENPRHALFTQAGNLSAKVTHAIQQVEDWQDWIEQNIQTAQRRYPDMGSPVGLVVIGRSYSLKAAEKQKLARRNITMRGRLRIETYDEIVIRARAYVAGIRQALLS